MTKTYFPFDTGAGASSWESRWWKMASLWRATGVHPTLLNKLETIGDSTGMNVKVLSGVAWIEGHYFESDAQETLAIAASDPTNPRIDCVVVQLDRINNIIDLIVLTGTPAASPTAPTLTQTSTIWEISTAQVAVAASVTTIAANNVTNERQYSYADDRVGLYSIREKMRLLWVDDDTIQVEAGACTINGTAYYRAATLNATFANLDTGARAIGKDYFVYAVPGIAQAWNIVLSLSASAPTGYTFSRLLGYFHNGKDYVGGGADGSIFQYSVCSNDLILPSTPYVAHPDLPAGVPLPGMVKCGSFAIGIYAASRTDATASAKGVSVVPSSRYGVVPWASIQGFEANAVAAAAGCRLPTIWEWWAAAMWKPSGLNKMTGAITGATNANPIVIAATSHGLATNDKVLIYGVGGNTAANGQWTITVINANSFSIPVAGNANYTTGGTWEYSEFLARQNGNTNSGASSDDATQSGTTDPTQAGRTLVGTGPRTQLWTAPGAGVSWYSPIGCADMVGNVWEWAAHLAAGLYNGVGYGDGLDWGFGDGDRVYNVDSYAYQPQTGGWTQKIPAMALLGGGWGYGADAGVRALSLDSSPGDSSAAVGFRLVR